MKRFFTITAGFLVVAAVLTGCASTPDPFRQTPWGTLPFGSDKAPWETLINGNDGLQNWHRTGDGNWLAMHGAIQIDRKNNQGAAFLYSKKSYTDFEMYVEFWADEDANSGVFYRITNTKIINTKGGYEVQIFDKNPPYPTASLVNVAKAAPTFKAAGKWNTFYITVKGPHMTVAMNGETAVDVSNATFPTGPIGLQYNSGTVKFRKLMIKPL
jgi:hypothetical protein